MPTPAFCVYRNGKIEVPEELRTLWQLAEGERFSASLSGELIVLTRLPSLELER